ncbi:hypothetical protein KFE25_010300 [Diacronema lutheri]|uniref:N-acetyltransferase domain-containing protein n=2 Tax=Diacronema lutheri TaxID=2081491 RepID=A0A8J5XNJ8_DIALT|nr:hypothetical protein KFE25_010300 [Diacronema lutheri]
MVSARAALLATCLVLGSGSSRPPLPRTLPRALPRAAVRALLPLRQLTADAGAPDGVVLGAVRAEDLGAVGRLLVCSFYPHLITLAPVGFSRFERALLETPVAWLNATYAGYLADSVRAFAERRVGAERLGAQSRSAALIAPRSCKGTTRGSSVALAAADEATGRLLAFVELSVRPLDGRVPFDVLDDLDALLRCVLPSQPPPCAYLCNLCVAPHARRRGIGAALVRASEMVVGSGGWGHDALYLHVGAHDAPTARLYRALGFEPLREYNPKRWQVQWLGAADVVFYRRWLGGSAARAAGADDLDGRGVGASGARELDA